MCVVNPIVFDRNYKNCEIRGHSMYKYTIIHIPTYLYTIETTETKYDGYYFV